MSCKDLIHLKLRRYLIVYAHFFHALHPRAAGGECEHRLFVNRFSHGRIQSPKCHSGEVYFNGQAGAMVQLTEM